MKKELIAFRDPKSPVSEVFRTLRTNIQFTNMNKKLKTLLITSTLPGEGKSWVASNLAITFAQANKRVVLIDADMRKGRQYSIFGIAPRPGLSNYLANSGEEGSLEEIEGYIQKTEVENLYVMSAGNVPPNPSELLITPQMMNLLKKLENACDIVIIDAPPCELVTDAVILSRTADSTVVVTAHKYTKKANLQRTIKAIKNVGGRIAGVVLNKVPTDAKKYEKSYYYGSQQSTNTKRREVKEFDSMRSKNIERDTPRVERVPKREEAVGKTTNDIFEQVNKYLENEKANLNKRRGENK